MVSLENKGIFDKLVEADDAEVKLIRSTVDELENIFVSSQGTWHTAGALLDNNISREDFLSLLQNERVKRSVIYSDLKGNRDFIRLIRRATKDPKNSDREAMSEALREAYTIIIAAFKKRANSVEAK